MHNLTQCLGNNGIQMDTGYVTNNLLLCGYVFKVLMYPQMTMFHLENLPVTMWMNSMFPKASLGSLTMPVF